MQRPCTLKELLTQHEKLWGSQVADLRNQLVAAGLLLDNAVDAEFLAGTCEALRQRFPAHTTLLHAIGQSCKGLAGLEGGALAAGGATLLSQQLDELEQRLLQQVKALYQPTYATDVAPTSSYERVWQKYQADGCILELTLGIPRCPSVPELPLVLKRVELNENTVLLPLTFDILRTVHRGSRSCLVQARRSVQSAAVTYVDTHDWDYLDKLRPDITVVPSGMAVSAQTALAVIELQVGTLDNGHRGKVLICLHELMNANDKRVMAKGVLFNGTEVQLFQAVRDDTLSPIRLYASAQLILLAAEAGETAAKSNWAKLWDFLFSEGQPSQDMAQFYGWAPPQLFVELDGLAARQRQSALTLKRLIASSRNVNVWEVQLPGQGLVEAVAKHYLGTARVWTWRRELHALLTIRSTPKKPELWPQLLGHADDAGQRVLVTAPLIIQPAGDMTYSKLCQLIDGVAWLHKEAKLVHRDLEVKHLGQHDGKLRAIDFSTAVPLAADSSQAMDFWGYAGTLINASEDVLQMLEGTVQQSGVPTLFPQLMPHVQQDLVPLVKTVYAMVHHSAQERIQRVANQLQRTLSADPTSVVEVAQRVRAFWQAEFSDVASPVTLKWRELVDLAHADAATEVWLPGPGQDAYMAAINQLKERLSVLVAPN